MKTTILCFLLVLTSNIIFGQTAYIQVNGEAGLSVFLNSQFKGKTSAEFNGLIIENVTPGKNLIKIVKEGFTPFEESITVKPGEVFAYKVKPFTKHLVEISEQGNTGETDKQVVIKTGKLIIQSVPIEIKITIPKIEGVENNQKTKDEWLADKIPTGSYEITFSYGQKIITKTVVIESEKITSVFINMLSGEFIVKTKFEEKVQRKMDSLTVVNTVDSLCRLYKFKCGLNESQFRSYNPEAATLIAWGGGRESNGQNTTVQKRDQTPGPYTYGPRNGRPIQAYEYILFGELYGNEKVLAFYNEQLAYYKRILPANYLYIQSPTNFYIYSPSGLQIYFYYYASGTDKHHKYSYIEMTFFDNNSYPRQ